MYFYWHSVLAFLIRILIIYLSQFFDKYSTGVQYTDIDYKVFTDASFYMLKGKSPYLRSTYRYTPLLAGLLIPNILFHNCYGKILFSFFDIGISIIIRKIISKSHPGLSNVCAYIWLYNPLSIIISTRGNADSISCFLVLLTLLFHIKCCYKTSAIFFALSVHVRVYPIIYGLVLYLSIDDDKQHLSIFKKVFYSILPNRKKIIFLLIFILSFITLTLPCYYLYGEQFLQESFLYHAYRLDVRHNFSIYFYLNYLLSSLNKTSTINSIITKLPALILLVIISFKFSKPEDLAFGMFILSFTFVTFNSVITSQYFVWFMIFLPICKPFFNFKLIEIINITLIWIFPQIGWLMFAYWLEFMGINTFQFIWIESIMFFIANVQILSILIDYYKCNKLKKM